MPKELIIYCDESTDRGRYYSDFFGGVLVTSAEVETIREKLETRKKELGFGGEVKWTKITQNYRQKYIELIDTFFDLVDAGKIKVRIIFSDNRFVATGLTKQQVDNKFFILYYEFIKYGFGLIYCNDGIDPINVRIYLDELPDTREKVAQFKGFLVGLTKNPHFLRARVRFNHDSITEVKSHEHVILQCLDVVLGAMQFRLNDHHKDKPPGKARRGKRTLAKEAVYRHINARIRAIYPHFNIGISTGHPNGLTDRWAHPYRHWVFRPNDHEIMDRPSKRSKK